MSDDLVKRLRSAARHPMMDNSCRADVFDVAEAAARIEQLAATNEKLEAKLDLSEGALDIASRSWGECQLVLEQTEAKLEKLIAGAETVLEEWDRGAEAAFREAVEEMRADVAEAKGDKT